MSYELFVGWRYLRASAARAWWIATLIFAFGLVGALILFNTSTDPTVRTAALIAIASDAICLAFCALKLLFSFFTTVSILGLAIGVSVLIGVLSVTSGFQNAFREKVLGVNAHVLVLKYGLDFPEYRDVIKKAEGSPNIVAAAPFFFHEMMLAKGNHLSGVLVKGVDPNRVGRVLDLPRHIEQSIDPKHANLQKLLHARADESDAGGIIIGREMAAKLSISVGDRVRLIAPLTGLDVAGWTAAGDMPRARDFTVTAIFYSGFDEYDRRLAYVSLKEAQAFFKQEALVTGVEMKIRNVFDAPKIAKSLNTMLGGAPYRTVDWGELNANLFRALQLQKLFLELVIGAIVVVAAFNVLAALAILVIRKTRQIAVLKSLGVSSPGIWRVFYSAGLFVWLVGTGLGLTWGYFGCRLLAKYGFQLDPKVYLISQLPVRMNVMEFVLTAIFALVVCMLATLYPAIRAAHLDPVEGLRR